MNIEEIIAAERWGTYHGATVSKDHNASLDRIESVVMKCLRELRNDDYRIIADKNERIAELEELIAANEAANKRLTRKAKEPCIHNDTVLKAINLAKWDDEDLDTFNTLSDWSKLEALRGANRQIEAIRKAYLNSIDTGKLCCPHCAGELRCVGISGIGSIYRCPDCNKIWAINEQEPA